MQEHPAVDDVRLVFAGKFRRYHGEGFKQLLDLKTIALNIRDFFLVLIGFIESTWTLFRLRPRVLFVKGGYIGVPVGLAAALLRIPYVTHDSDAIAGLANRIIARWARVHAVALPKETYAYPPESTVTVGVPIAAEIVYVNTKIQRQLKTKLGFDPGALLIAVTGGGLGAQSLNMAVVANAVKLLDRYPKLHIVHSAGHAHMAATQAAYAAVLKSEVLSRVAVHDFITTMYEYTAAADVVIARAGATNMAELAMQAKACIVVPNPFLTGGHQTKNARAYAEAGAAEVIEHTALQAHPEILFEVLTDLLDSPSKRAALAGKIHGFAHPDSSSELAELIMSAARDIRREG